MSLGQTMISIATLVALTIMVVTSQRYLIEGQKQAISAECLDLATMQADALFAEITRKQFDQNVTYDYYQPESEFESAYSLGPSSDARTHVSPWPDLKPFKSIPYFTDIDDYNGYERNVNTDLITGIQLSVAVFYVAESNPDNIVYYRTYLKRIEVTAQHPLYLEPITFGTVVAY
jgi:hypothetical protein